MLGALYPPRSALDRQILCRGLHPSCTRLVICPAVGSHLPAWCVGATFNTFGVSTPCAEGPSGGLYACVAVGRDAVHLFLDLGTHSERLDEVIDGLLGDVLVGAGQLLEGFVGLGVAFTAQDGL